MHIASVPAAIRSARLSDILDRQHGVASRRQLRACGFSDDMIMRMIRDGRLHRVHRGVYSVVARLSYPAKLVAAQLSVSDSAVTGSEAARFRGHLKRGRESVVVTSTTARRPPNGAQLLRTAWLPPAQVEVVDGIVMTTTSRTIVDYAPAAPTPYIVANVMHEAEFRDQLMVDEVAAIGARLGTRSGAGTLIRAVELVCSGSAGTMSASEDRALELELRAGIPEPWINRLVAGRRELHRLDQYFPELGLNVEIDGKHDRKRSVMEDDERDEDLEGMDIMVVRFRAALVWNDPREFVRQVLYAREQARLRLASGSLGQLFASHAKK